jgi:purine catabolism regulator
MATTARELLELPILFRARPEVLSGHLDVPVRWVHTSEIFEIDALLQGGELLLTTGLGLVREPPHRLAAYIDGLAERRVAGVVLELGRPFAEVPEAMVEAARARELLLIAFHEVVPWVQVTEAAHRLLVSREIEGLRRMSVISRNLLACVARGSDLPGILEVIAREVGMPVGFIGKDESEVWSRGTSNLPSGPFTTRIVQTSHGAVGEIRVPEAAVAESELLDAAASAVAAIVGATPVGEGHRALHLRTRLNDVISAAPEFGSQHRRVLTELAIDPSPLHPTHSFIIMARGSTSPGPLIETVSHRFFGVAVASETALGVLVLAQDPLRTSGSAEDSVFQFASDVRRELPGSVLIEGEPQRTMSDLGRELHDLQALVADPSVRRSEHIVIYRRDTTLLRLLAHLDDVSDIERFVSRELGSVLEHDAHNRPPLMPTLLALLSSDSKVAAAERLGVSRQTMHQRSQILEGMLGLGPAAPLTRRAAATLAALLWQWRTTNTM